MLSVGTRCTLVCHRDGLCAARHSAAHSVPAGFESTWVLGLLVEAHTHHTPHTSTTHHNKHTPVLWPHASNQQVQALLAQLQGLLRRAEVERDRATLQLKRHRVSDPVGGGAVGNLGYRHDLEGVLFDSLHSNACYTLAVSVTPHMRVADTHPHTHCGLAHAHTHAQASSGQVLHQAGAPAAQQAQQAFTMGALAVHTTPCNTSGSAGASGSSLALHDSMLAARPRCKKYKASRDGSTAAAAAGLLGGSAAGSRDGSAAAAQEQQQQQEEEPVASMQGADGSQQAAAAAGDAAVGATAAAACIMDEHSSTGASAVTTAAATAAEGGGEGRPAAAAAADMRSQGRRSSSAAVLDVTDSPRGSQGSSCDSCEVTSPSTCTEPVVVLTPSTDDARPPVSR
jgi:hypothetical protein